MKDANEAWLAIEKLMDDFTARGGLSLAETKNSYPKLSNGHDQIEWSYKMGEVGSFLAFLYMNQCQDEFLPALSVELAIATVVPGSRSRVMRWALQRNLTIDGLIRIGLNQDHLVVGLQIMPDNHSFDLLQNTLQRLPTIAERILWEISKSGLTVSPLCKTEDEKKQNLQ